MFKKILVYLVIGGGGGGGRNIAARACSSVVVFVKSNTKCSPILRKEGIVANTILYYSFGKVSVAMASKHQDKKSSEKRSLTSFV